VQHSEAQGEDEEVSILTLQSLTRMLHKAATKLGLPRINVAVEFQVLLSQLSHRCGAFSGAVLPCDLGLFGGNGKAIGQSTPQVKPEKRVQYQPATLRIGVFTGGFGECLCCAAKCNRGGKKFKCSNLNTVSWQAQLLLQVPEDPHDVPPDKDVPQSGYQVAGHLNFLPDQAGAIP
jgi:hypothetical protein